MADYFIDTSALVKYYHPEDGTQAVTRLIEEPASYHYISRLSLVETVSAFAVKYRMGHINDQEFDDLRRRFYHDIGQGHFRIMPMTTARYQDATQLIERHFRISLRTLDALQLAVALALSQRGMIDHVGPAGAFVQEYTVMPNAFSNKKLYGHEKARHGRPPVSDCTVK